MKTVIVAASTALFALCTVLLFLAWQYREENRSLREQMNRIEVYARQAAESAEAARRSAESTDVSADSLHMAKRIQTPTGDIFLRRYIRGR